MRYKEEGTKIGALVEEKNKAYGNSFNEAHAILKVLYPNGIAPKQYNDILALIRIIDKIFRIATKSDYLNEDSWADIAGYAILKCVSEEDEQLKREFERQRIE